LEAVLPFFQDHEHLLGKGRVPLVRSQMIDETALPLDVLFPESDARSDRVDFTGSYAQRPCS